MRPKILIWLVVVILCVSISDAWARSWHPEIPSRTRVHYTWPKDPNLAGFLSTLFPGMGQIYAGSPGKGLLFLIAEAGVWTAAAIQLDRAFYYDDLSDRYDLFYDPYSESYLNYEQGYQRARGHAWLGTGLILAGVGMHIWNIQDAAHTAHRYNREHRLSVGVRLAPEPNVACSVRF